MKSILGHEMKLGWGTVSRGRLQGAEMYLDLENPVLQTMLDGSYDAYIYEYLAQSGLDLANAVAWDVGAEIGYHSLMLATYAGHVLSIEPNPHNVARIERQLERNPDLAQRIEIAQMALSDSDGEQVFRFSENPALASIGHLDLHGAPGDRVKPEIYAQLEEQPVQTRRIDSLIAAGEPAPAFIKLDVEGAEAEVLGGASHLLKTQRPIMAVEVHNVSAMFHVQALLFEAAYRTILVDEPERSASRAFLWATPLT